MFAGLVVLVIGVFYLLKNVGVIPSIAWHIVWPVGLIALGIYFVFQRRQ